MSSILSITSSSCINAPSCFYTCMRTMSYLVTSSTTASFGPYYGTTGGCSCTGFTIYNAQTTSSTALGSSPGGSPISSASLSSFVSSGRISGTWSFSNLGSCSLSYYVSNGAPVLGVASSSSYYFTYWWAVLVTGIILCGICFAGVFFCGLCAACCPNVPRYKGQTLAPPPGGTAAPVQGQNADGVNMGYVYSTSPANPQPYVYNPSGYTDNTHQGQIPMATAVPVGTQPSTIPIAFANETQDVRTNRNLAQV